MRVSFVFLATLAYVAADFVSYKVEHKFADAEFLEKQKFFLDILKNIHQPLVQEDYVKDSLHCVSEESHYTNYAPVVEFFKIQKLGLLPQHYVYSIFNKHHLKETVALFNLFYYSKDWTTFYKNVLWARQHVNEAMFTYALTVAVLHRKDTIGIVLPPLYEICPYMFFDSHVISDAISYKMQNMHKFEKLHTIVGNYTSKYYKMNEESKLAYFTEDIGWNAYYYYFNIDYPFWMGGKEFHLDKDRRGEQYLYMYQQLLARYYLERLSNGLGVIPEISYMKPIKSGYHPMLRYYNGIGFSMRKNYYEVSDNEDYYTLNLIEDYERRIRDVIDFGVYVLPDGNKINLRKPESINYLGNLIQSNPDSVDNEFFGPLTNLARLVLGGGDYNYYHKYKVEASVLEYGETAMRDPIFYQFYKRIVKYYFKFKDYLKPYTHEQLAFPGVYIENVHVGKLLTYFDYFESDITSAVDMAVYPAKQVQEQTESSDYVIKVKQMRLNHKSFTINVDVVSDKQQKVVVRVYMGPKYDQYGSEYTIDENRKNFVEIDQYVYDLPAGHTTIKGGSTHFYYSTKDRTTYLELYKKVVMAMEDKTKFEIDMSESHCGFPDRLLLPKGHVDGMPMVFFVVITPYMEMEPKQYSTYDPNVSCGVGSGSRFVDNLSFGYPLDRPIHDVNEFITSNMYFKDVYVYHKIPEVKSNIV